MKQETVTIHSIEHLTKEILELTFISDFLGANANPGQFVNILVDRNFPLLRRPFSIFSIDENRVSIVFNVIGRGTQVLATKRVGDTVDIVASCGNSFLSFVEGEYVTAVFVAGGIGVAPFSFFTKKFPPGKNIVTYIGGRSKDHIIKKGLKNFLVATDDGSEGFHGTVLELIKNDFEKNDYGKIRFFTCGPTRMMKALADYAEENGHGCYASLETDMACGIGLCQGCNVEMASGEKKYKLVCKEGTIFDTQTIKFS
jgi:dihydroorotate dehydrogenase electron transfer subunit